MREGFIGWGGRGFIGWNGRGAGEFKVNVMFIHEMVVMKSSYIHLIK